jgi:hypothetical protein
MSSHTGGSERRLTRREVSRLVNDWIGVADGYLGDFNYTTHDRFWLEACDLDVDTNAYPGTTRQCFEETLFGATSEDQAAVLRAILDDYPPLPAPTPGQPNFRTPALHREIQTWVSRLETGQVSIHVELAEASAVVRRALEDVDVLMRTSGPQSAVDRVHTAMHGYLLRLCDEAEIERSDRPTMNQIFKALRATHPALADMGARGEDVSRVLGSLATILDALNPVRNNASVAHPNDELIGEAEALLIINTVQTMLSYFERKRGSIGIESGIGVAPPARR